MSGRLIRVKVPCEFRDCADNGRQGYNKAVFELGLGPCGKNVIGLDGYFDEAGYRLQQMHDDGTYKVFFYPARTLVGRVEEEYALAH